MIPAIVIKDKQNIGNIKLKSYDDEVTFTNGEKNIIIPVDALNRFTAEIEIYIPDENTEENHEFKISINNIRINYSKFFSFYKSYIYIISRSIL